MKPGCAFCFFKTFPHDLHVSVAEVQAYEEGVEGLIVNQSLSDDEDDGPPFAESAGCR